MILYVVRTSEDMLFLACVSNHGLQYPSSEMHHVRKIQLLKPCHRSSQSSSPVKDNQAARNGEQRGPETHR